MNDGWTLVNCRLMTHVFAIHVGMQYPDPFLSVYPRLARWILTLQSRNGTTMSMQWKIIDTLKKRPECHSETAFDTRFSSVMQHSIYIMQPTRTHGQVSPWFICSLSPWVDCRSWEDPELGSLIAMAPAKWRSWFTYSVGQTCLNMSQCQMLIHDSHDYCGWILPEPNKSLHYLDVTRKACAIAAPNMQGRDFGQKHTDHLGTNCLRSRVLEHCRPWERWMQGPQWVWLKMGYTDATQTWQFERGKWWQTNGSQGIWCMIHAILRQTISSYHWRCQVSPLHMEPWRWFELKRWFPQLARWRV